MAQSKSRPCLSAFSSGLPLLLALIVTLAPTTVHSQSASATGRLEGTVTDSSGAAVSGADIAVRNQYTGISTTITSYLNPSNATPLSLPLAIFHTARTTCRPD